MGLYLCVFDYDDELEGVEVGSYSDFDFFRRSVTDSLEGGIVGSRFPTLIMHPDSDGEWSSAECESLRQELVTIAREFQQLPGIPFPGEWQQQVGRSLGLIPGSLYESFIDVDGELLLDRLIRLCDVAIERAVPLLFQ
jgi:Immunity protein 70